MAVHATKEGGECAIKMEDGALSLLWFALVLVTLLLCNRYLTITRINGHLCKGARKLWKDKLLWILDLDTQYFIEDVGQKSCQNGTKIMNAQGCTTACNTLTTNIGRMKDGKPCYIAGNGNCRQAGRGGKKSSLVCMQKGNLGILLGNNTTP